MTVLVTACTLAAVLTAFSQQIGLFIACGIALYALYSVSLPVLQNMVAQQAKPGQKNLVMGFYNATKSLGSIAGSLMAGFLYEIHIRLPFLVIAVVYFLSVPVMLGYWIYCTRRQPGTK